MAGNYYSARFTDNTYDFFKLPPELRCRVYNPMNDAKPTVDPTAQAERVSFDAKSVSSQLLRTWKVLYEEAIASLYATRMIDATDISMLDSLLTTISTFACSFVRTILICPKTHSPHI
jgi:hypothetical protein